MTIYLGDGYVLPTRVSGLLEVNRELLGIKEQTMTDKIERLRAEALRLLEQANQLEENHIEEPVDDDGNGLVWFTKRYSHYREGANYTYAAVRVPATGMWYLTGVSQVTHQLRNGRPWEELVEFIRDAQGYQLWSAVEYVKLGESE